MTAVANMHKKVALIVGLLFLAFISVVVYVRYTFFVPGLTCRQTAKLLARGSIFIEMRTVIERAEQCGDSVLMPLVEATDNFSHLSGASAPWMAEVLGTIRSEASQKILTDLFNRRNGLARMVGAAGLTAHGKYPEEIEAQKLLAKIAQKGSDAESQLALLALSKTVSDDALPILLSILEKRHVNYGYHAEACDAVARMQAREAIPILRQALADPTFHALPHAFRALITLGDTIAVPLAIERISPSIESKNEGFVVRELEKVTGRNFGYSRERWLQWWRAAKDEWSIPERFTSVPFDEQEPAY